YTPSFAIDFHSRSDRMTGSAGELQEATFSMQETRNHHSHLESDGSALDTEDAPREPKPKQPLTVDNILNRDEEDERDHGHLEQLLSMDADSMKNLEEGEIRRGRIVRVDADEVVVDIGFKSEGVIPLSEFGDPDAIRVGDEIDVFLEKMETQDGLVVLSKQRADFLKVWDRVREAADRGEVVEGRITRK